MKKNKKIISIILTLLMIFSIVATSLVPTISSHAEENMDLVSRFGITTDDILNQDDFELSNEYISGLRPYVTKNSTEYTTCVDCVQNNSFDFSNVTLDEVQATWASFNNIVVSVNGLVYQSYLIPDGSFIVYENSSFSICMPQDLVPMDNYVRLPSFRYENGNCDITTSSFSTSQNLRTIDDKQYYYYSLSQYSMVATSIISNLPIYYTDGTTITSIIGASDINYSKLGGNEGAVKSHKKLRDGSGIWLDNVNCNEGTVYVVVNSDNTQTSANGYKIRYWVDCWYTVKLPFASAWGSTSKNMQNTLQSYGYSANGGSTTTVHGVYYWNDNPYQEIGLSEISANGGIWKESLSATNMYLVDHSKPISTLANTIVSGSNWTQNAIDGLSTLPTHILTGSASGYSANNYKLASMATSDFEVTDIKYNFHYKLYQNDEELGFIDQPYSLVSSTGNTGRGDTVENLIGSDEDYYNVGTEGMSEGEYNTDYAASNDIRVSNGGSGGSSNSSSDNNSSNSTTGGNANIGDGAIVINNNPTFNNSSTASADSSSSGFGGFLSTLISLIANGKTSSVETISSISGTTGYTNLVNTYLSSVPTSLWNVIIVTMTALLSISIIGFIVGLLFKIFF